MTCCKVAFVDLDGTITSSLVNNTFDFIKAYYIHRYGKAGWLIYLCLTLVIQFFTSIFNVSRYLMDVLMINTLFFGHKKDLLNRFSITWLALIKKYMNLEVIKLLNDLKSKGYIVIMLTCCTEVPASQIARVLKFDGYLSRNLKLQKDFVIGLKENKPCHILKMEHVISYLRTLPKPTEVIYIVDEESYHNEIDITNLFDKILIVKDGSICINQPSQRRLLSK